jgi:hypothetical protein
LIWSNAEVAGQPWQAITPNEDGGPAASRAV